MIYRSFQGLQLSLLGMGCMRLPTLPDKSIDEEQTQQMVDTAIANGINYFDTAWPYHAGKSEIIIGKALSKYPRDSWYLADKYPGHQIASSYDPKAVFEEQLKKCGVEYFDFYLLHNVCESSLPAYEDERWGIIPYFAEQKRLGRIRHLGFSSHADAACLKSILECYGDLFEFCQIQLNYLDWTLQQAKEKVRLLNEHHMPIWVMEPLHGGKLCNLTEAEYIELNACTPGMPPVEWAFRWLMDIPGISMILSGMSSMEQMSQNISLFEKERPLSDEEHAAVQIAATAMAGGIPCTGCRYCCDGCPMHLDIPKLMTYCNELSYAPTVNVRMRVDSWPKEQHPVNCIGCGQCTAICPQKIDIPTHLREMTEKLQGIRSWNDICREREEESRKLAAQKAN